MSQESALATPFVLRHGLFLVAFPKSNETSWSEELMTIDEAVETSRVLVSSPLLCETKDYRDAVKLGIEALKHFKYHRDLNIISFVKRLPGETE